MRSPLFFCAIGGSGMLPLALMLKAQGADVRGSDRGRDQGRTPERFAFIERQGIRLFPQDGSGVTADIAQVIVSAAVEDTVPDVQAARSLGLPVRKRAALLAEIFNGAMTSIAVAGTSGKSTTTGMIGWLLRACGRNPSIVNGAVMKNFVTPESPFAAAALGDPALFVAEVDESDGSIALYNPTVAVLNNVALDHKSLDELRDLFGAYLSRAKRCVVNLDHAEVAALAAPLPEETKLTYGLQNETAQLRATDLAFLQDGVRFNVRFAPTNETATVRLRVPGEHNVANALAALGAALTVGLPLAEAARALEDFSGIARRLEVVGTAGGVTVIDDFAHNPDKIAATLACLHRFPGRLLLLFQPHGYGPLKLMKAELAACFADHMAKDDLLYVPDALYLGGTTDKTVTSADLAAAVAALGGKARYLPSREDALAALLAEAQPGDRLVIMGARDDTLSRLAQEALAKLTAISLIKAP